MTQALVAVALGSVVALGCSSDRTGEPRGTGGGAVGPSGGAPGAGGGISAGEAGGVGVGSGGAATGGTATGGSTTGGAGHAGPGATGGAQPSDLLTDPNVPECTISAQTADMRIDGELDGRPVHMQQIPGSYIVGGKLWVSGTYSTDAGYRARDELVLRWTGSLAPAAVTRLEGGSVYVSEDQPRGNHAYCFSAGELAPVDSGVPGDPGRLFKFRLRGFSANGDCSGGTVTGALSGCIHRLHPELE